MLVVYQYVYCVFCFKQKTAYEMRSSDWSSDVCSSDLLFPGSAALLGLADALVELKAVCECGRKATMNLRVDAQGRTVVEGAQTEIGGNDRYVAMCRRH